MKPFAAQKGFTLIELIVVVLLIAVMFGVVGFRSGTFAFWKEESFVRRLSETLVFLHHQAVTDQAFYRIEFDLAKNSYRIGVMKAEASIEDAEIIELAQDAGNLTLELAAMLNPSVSEEATMIPPPSFPSLAEPVPFPQGMSIEDVRTVRGLKKASEGGVAFIHFSPRGFSDFALIHLETSSGAPVTIGVNPFTGTSEVYREYVDFEAPYGRKVNDAN